MGPGPGIFISVMKPRVIVAIGASIIAGVVLGRKIGTR